MATKKECEWCGEPLTIEEIEYPPKEGLICDDCYHDHYEFECCICCNYGHVDHQHDFLVVGGKGVRWCGRGPVHRGIYAVLKGPYFGGPMIGSGYLFREALKKVAKLPPKLRMDGYPCGHLCKECQNKLGLVPLAMKDGKIVRQLEPVGG